MFTLSTPETAPETCTKLFFLKLDSVEKKETPETSVNFVRVSGEVSGAVSGESKRSQGDILGLGVFFWRGFVFLNDPPTARKIYMFRGSCRLFVLQQKVGSDYF